MFDKILIANRGEIAVRVMRTAAAMGIKTVAVYSDADARAVHVDMADEAVAIGPPPAAQSYLNIDAIIDACRATGAEAVHPGYGFLSENPAFVAALEDAGIAFIGPNRRAIEIMGDKIASKKFAAKAGVSIVPGHVGEIASAERAVEIAEDIGYPVMLKASAGGGGKGMRIARSRHEVSEGFAAARAEAASSFGDDRVFVEKFIENPRHVEIQVLGDKHGNVIHLGERECSIQRRNQKVVEEAPSPLLDAKTRKAMGEQAVALARAVDYDSAGTVEFVAGQDRSFYFLEMNTRLQVEHPVTELVTGIDLVEHMIRAAANERLSLKQKDVRINGWAIEARIYAEDPEREFMPSTGRLVCYRPPSGEGLGEGVVVRNDTGVNEGGEISLYYDPMIAKLCVHAPERAGAIEAMADALDEFVIDGIRHNISFLAAIMANERWRRGDLSTAFIAEEFADGFAAHAGDEEIERRLAAVAVAADHVDNARRRAISGQMTGRAVEFSRRREVFMAGRWRKVTVEEQEGGLLVLRWTDGGKGKKMVLASKWRPGERVWHGTVNGVSIAVQIARHGIGWRLSQRGLTGDAVVYSAREAELARLMPEKPEEDTSRRLVCPMPGLIVDVLVEAGHEVKAGEALCIVEAMKMQNTLRAERSATVAAVHVKPGDSLGVDETIMEFE